MYEVGINVLFYLNFIKTLSFISSIFCDYANRTSMTKYNWAKGMTFKRTLVMPWHSRGDEHASWLSFDQTIIIILKCFLYPYLQ